MPCRGLRAHRDYRVGPRPLLCRNTRSAGRPRKRHRETEIHRQIQHKDVSSRSKPGRTGRRQAQQVRTSPYTRPKKRRSRARTGTPKNILVSPVHCSSRETEPRTRAKKHLAKPGAVKPARSSATECMKEKVEGSVTSADKHEVENHLPNEELRSRRQHVLQGGKADEITTETLESELSSTRPNQKRRAGLRSRVSARVASLAQYEIEASAAVNIEVFGEVLAATDQASNTPTRPPGPSSKKVRWNCSRRCTPKNRYRRTG